MTINEVARRAGTSTKTVSRVVNRESHVRGELRERVLKAIRELGYQPNFAARQLAGRRSFVIVMVIHPAISPFHSALLAASAEECNRHGYHLAAEVFHANDSAETLMDRILSRLRPDGIILAAPQANDAAMIAIVKARGLSLVRVAGTTGGHGTAVLAPNKPVSRLLMEHLLELGHRRIGLVAPPFPGSAAQERVAAYREALVSRNLPVDEALIVQGDYSFMSGVEGARQLLAMGEPPTAIFAASDTMAAGVMATAAQRGLSIPDDLAVAGFDDAPISRMVYPALTTVRQPVAALGRAAVHALLDLPIEEEFRFELLVRGSTGGATAIEATAWTE